MSTLAFDHGAYLLFLLAIPAAVLLRRHGLLAGFAVPLTLADWGDSDPRHRVRTPTLIRVLHTSVEALMALSFTAAVVALASPVRVREERVYTSRGTEIAFVIDISPSMSALDMDGTSRINAARDAIRMLAEDAAGGTAYALVASATETALTVPATLDAQSFFAALDALAVGTLGDSSALGSGIGTAVYHMDASPAPKKCIVLLTDGEHNAGSIHPYTAASLAKDKGITLYVLGIGKRGSVPIDYTDPRTGEQYSGYFNSQFDEGELRTIADAGGGTYFPAATVSELRAALRTIAGREHTGQSWYAETKYTHYYAVVLLIAAVAASLAWFIRRLCLRETL